MSLLILRRDCGAVYPLGVVVNLVGAARGRERLNTHRAQFLRSVAP